MRLLSISLACLLFFPGLLSARIGETLAECQTRYGPVVERLPAEFSGSDPEVSVFSKSGVTVLVEFHEGKAWHITYRKPMLTSAEIDALLKADAGDGEWGSSLKVTDSEYRLSADKQRLSILTPRKGAVQQTTLQIVTREYTTQFHAVAAVETSSAGTKEAIKRKVNPLPGF